MQKQARITSKGQVTVPHENSTDRGARERGQTFIRKRRQGHTGPAGSEQERVFEYRGIGNTQRLCNLFRQLCSRRRAQAYCAKFSAAARQAFVAAAPPTSWSRESLEIAANQR